MCKPPPGPPCAAHTRPVLDAAARDAEVALRAARSAEETKDSDALIWSERRHARVTVHVVRADAREALRQLDIAQRDYDSTPTGQKELEAAIAAATGNEDRRQRTYLSSRLARARLHRAAVMTWWKASSPYIEERLTALLSRHDIHARTQPGDHLDSLPESTQAKAYGFVEEMVQRRCADHEVPTPPRHPRSHAAWEASDAHGLTWATIARHLGPLAADLTYSDPDVHAAAAELRRAANAPAAVSEPTDGDPDPVVQASDRVLTASARVIPAALAPTRSPQYHLYRAAATRKPWVVTVHGLTDLLVAEASPIVDRDGIAATGAHPGDLWHTQRLTGPIRIADEVAPTTATTGWICVRQRDLLWRILPHGTYAARFPTREPIPG